MPVNLVACIRGSVCCSRRSQRRSCRWYSYNQAIHQLLEHVRVHPAVWLDDRVPRRKVVKPGILHTVGLAEDTAAWGLRVDYVLPAGNWKFYVAVFSGPTPMKRSKQTKLIIVSSGST